MWLLSVAALLAGSSLVLAFAPFHWYGMAVIAPAILLYCWLRVKPWPAAWLGLCFGVGFFTCGVSWIYHSLKNFGNMPMLLAAATTGLFILLLSSLFFLQGYGISKLSTRIQAGSGHNTENNKTNIKSSYIYNLKYSLLLLIIFPSSWVFFEFTRANLFTGFPWLLLGSSQPGDLFLQGWLPIVGVFGLSWLITVMSGSLVLLSRLRARLISQRLIKRSILTIIPVIVITSIIIFGYFLSSIHWTHPVGKPIKTVLIQGNVPQSIKWDPQYVQSTLEKYRELSAPYWSRSQVIIWPEGAIPAFPYRVRPYLQQLSATAKQHGVYLLTGIPLSEFGKYYNGLLLLGAGSGQYLKRHLVPFGEYFPLQWLLSGIVRYYQIPMSNFTAGPEDQRALLVAGIRVAPFICYEIAYSREVLASIAGRQLIVVVTDDAWFGNSIALNQHLQIAETRALETGRELLLATNTGISALVNSHGAVVKRLPDYVSGALAVRAQPMSGMTPLMQFGYWPLFVLLGILFMLAYVFCYRRRNN